MVHGLAQEARTLAQEVLDHDRWFRELDRSMKDEFSQPNHDRTMADYARRLAEAVLHDQ